MVTLLYMPNQMANRLFVMANVVANSIENDRYTVSSPCFLDYAHLFQKGSTDALFQFNGAREFDWSARKRALAMKSLQVSSKLGLLKNGRRYGENLIIDTELEFDPVSSHYTISDSSFQELREANTNLCLIGFRARDKKALFRQRAEVMEFFAPRQDFMTQAQNILRDLSASVSVGVHIRLGDYRNWNGGIYAYSFEAYKLMLDQVKDAYGPGTKFMITCNEPIPGEVFEGLDYVQGPGNAMGDLCSLSLCDVILGPPSTFNSWAAMMSNAPLYHIYDSNLEISRDNFKIPNHDNTP